MGHFLLQLTALLVIVRPLPIRELGVPLSGLCGLKHTLRLRVLLLPWRPVPWSLISAFMMWLCHLLRPSLCCVLHSWNGPLV